MSFFIWDTLFAGSGPPPEVVSRDLGPCLNKISKTELFDIIVCGGTLGIFIAATLARRGLRVAIIERGRLQGVCYIAHNMHISFQ